MKRHSADIENYDYLGLSVRKGMREEIEAAYRAFGWSVIERREDEKEDRSLLDLRREHKLKNKDRLQLLQVHLETSLNLIGEKQRSYRNRLRFIEFFGVLVGLIAMLYGSYVLVAFEGNLFTALGAICTAMGFVLIVATLSVSRVMRKNYSRKFVLLAKKTRKEIEGLCSEARQLLGEKEAE